MQRGHKLIHRPALDMPEGFDPSGIPSVAGGTRPGAASSHRRHARRLPGLAPASLIASVEEVAAQDEGDWLVWGCVGGRPLLFAVEAGAAAEMMGSVIGGEKATAIVEPWQLMLERLD